MVWESEPDNISIPTNSVHVWMMDLDANKSLASSLSKMLSPDEKKKATRYYFEIDSLRYTVARATLRLLLSRYLKQQPTALEFGYTEFGKPFLKGDGPPLAFSFNVSHSAHLALFAFSTHAELGVDIEEHKNDLATLDIANRFFFGAEIDELKSCSKADFGICFFNCWTRKEAYIKAKGMGLSLPLNSFAVEARKYPVSKLLVSHRFPEDTTLYSIVPFEPAPHFSAAFAVNAPVQESNFIKMDMLKFWHRERQANG